MNAEQRFRAKTRPSKLLRLTTPCWVWTGAKNPSGYGRFQNEWGKLVTAHRWAYQHWVGPIPEGYDIDHLCRNRACVRPSHLEAVTRAENQRRGIAARITHCPKGHAYTDENLIHRRGARANNRTCRTCEVERQRALRADPERRARINAQRRARRAAASG